MSAAVAAVAPPCRDLLAVVDDASVRVAVLAASRDPNAKVSILVLPRDRERQRTVIKVPTTAVAAAAVARERRVLLGLQEIGSALVETTVPRVIDTIAAGEHLAIELTMLPGTPLTTLYHRWRHTRSPRRVAADIGAVATWLRRLHAETAAAAAPVEMDGGVIDRLVERFGLGGDVMRILERVNLACGALRAHTAPRTVVHGDLWCGNVLVEGGRVTGVVDWEEAVLSGEPLRDLARFALTYGLYLDRHTRPGAAVAGHPGLRAGAWGAGVEHLLDGDGWICDQLRAFVRLGMRRLGVPGELWREALIAGVAEVAARADDEQFARGHLELLGRAVGARS